MQANETLYNNSMNEGTFDVALDFQGDSVDEPTYQLARHLSVDISSNRGKYTDRELDKLFEQQKDETDPAGALQAGARSSRSACWPRPTRCRCCGGSASW